MLGDLAGLVGSMAGKATDSMFWPFAAGFLILGYRRKVIWALPLAVAGAALNLFLVRDQWAAVGVPDSEVPKLFLIRILWAAVLAGLARATRFVRRKSAATR